MHHIKSEVTIYPASTEAHPSLWKTEIQKILAVFGVCVSCFGVVQFLNYLRVTWSWMMPPCPTKLNNLHRGPPARIRQRLLF